MTRLPDFSLTSTDGTTVTPADLRGRPHVLYLSRHLGCTVCQARVRALLEHREELAARGARLVVVVPADLERARAWQRLEGAHDVTVLADPGRRLAGAVRTNRRNLGWLLHRRTLLDGLRELRHGRLPTYRAGDDPAALGADLVLDAAGRVVMVHRATSAGDRRAPAELLRVLDGLPQVAARP